MLLLLSIFNVSWAGKKSAVIKQFWVEKDDGITAHVDFDLKNFKNERVYIRLNIYDENTKEWCGTTANAYCMGAGEPVARVLYDEPTENNKSYRDIKLHISSEGMQLKLGSGNYYAAIEIGPVGETLARSKPCAFSAFGMGGDKGYPGWVSYGGPLNDIAPTPSVYNPYYANTNTNSTKYNSGGTKSTDNTIGTLATAAVIGIIGYALIDSFSGSSSSKSNSTQTKVSNKLKDNNVEIMSWYGIGGWLSIAQACVTLRNNNNRDMYVSIDLYQKKEWHLGSIVYGDYCNSDRVPGVSDARSSRILVKAGSIRKVYLSAKYSSEPEYISIYAR